MKKKYLLILFLAISTIASAQVLVINEVYHDPASDVKDEDNNVIAILGDANGDGVRGTFDDEFIELVNNTTGDLDISGYRIYDKERYDRLTSATSPDDGPNHTVPASTIIPAGDLYVVFGGGDVSAIDALPNVTAHAAITAPSELIRETGWDGKSRLDLQDSGDFVYILGPAGDDTIITSYDSDTDVGEVLDFNQSAHRLPAITGAFKVHTNINGAYFSPGIISVAQHTTNQLVLNEIFAKPGDDIAGDANNDNAVGIDDEFLEIINNSGAPIDMSGYHVYDRNRYQTNPPRPKHVFPSGTILANGKALVLFAGGLPDGTFGDAIVQVANGFDENLSVTESQFEIFFITDGSGIAHLGNILSMYTSDEIGNLDTSTSRSRNPDITGDFADHPDVAGKFYSPGYKIDGTTAFEPVLSIDNFIESNLKVYLTNNNTSLKIEGQIDGENKLKIYNMLGKEVFKTSFNINKTNLVTLPSIQRGIYIIQMSNSLFGSISKKILIE